MKLMPFSCQRDAVFREKVQPFLVSNGPRSTWWNRSVEGHLLRRATSWLFKVTFFPFAMQLCFSNIAILQFVVLFLNIVSNLLVQYSWRNLHVFEHMLWTYEVTWIICCKGQLALPLESYAMKMKMSQLPSQLFCSGISSPYSAVQIALGLLKN